jgi:very-short-patch-repair endonuclease
VTNADRTDAAVELAVSQDGVLSRAQARGLGLDRWAVAHQVERRRWRLYGDQGIAVHLLPLTARARCRIAAWEAGADAVLDGSTSLTWQGLKNFDDGIHLMVPWPSTARSWQGSRVHPSRLWNRENFVVKDGQWVTRCDVAAIRAGMWARSDRAGATVMAMAVQQRLTTGASVLLEAKRLNRHKRRPLLLTVAKDIAEGAQALSELDFAALCRRRGLPEPSRQKVRRGDIGRVYLDVLWDDLGVVVEVEGAHHDAPENAIDDSLRQNALTISRLDVLRIPVIGLRTCPDLFLEQVEAMLRTAGWNSAA